MRILQRLALKFRSFRNNVSLRTKRFQSSYCPKVRAEAKKKKGGRGRGRGEEETLARKPHDSEKRPLIFHGPFTVRLVCKLTARQNRSTDEQITPLPDL